MLDAEDKSADRAEVGGDEPEGDGHVHVEAAKLPGGEGALEKVRASHGEGEGGGGEGDEHEEPGEFVTGLESQVRGQGEGHRVHREACGDAETGEEGVALLRGLVVGGVAKGGGVAVAMEVAHEVEHGEFTGIPPEGEGRT